VENRANSVTFLLQVWEEGSKVCIGERISILDTRARNPQSL